METRTHETLFCLLRGLLKVTLTLCAWPDKIRAGLRNSIPSWLFLHSLGGLDLLIILTHSLYEGLQNALTHGSNPGDNPVLQANNPATETICEPRIT